MTRHSSHTELLRFHWSDLPCRVLGPHITPHTEGGGEISSHTDGLTPLTRGRRGGGDGGHSGGGGGGGVRGGDSNGGGGL